jgi:hypothetical protein
LKKAGSDFSGTLDSVAVQDTARPRSQSRTGGSSDASNQDIVRELRAMRQQDGDVRLDGESMLRRLEKTDELRVDAFRTQK